MRLMVCRRFSHLAVRQRLELFEGARPVRTQQPGQTAIGKNFSTSLAASAVVGFVVRVANALNFFSTPRARLSVAAVNSHILAKRGHFFGKGCFRLCAQAVYPEPERVARRGEQPLPFAGSQLVREGDGRQL